MFVKENPDRKKKNLVPFHKKVPFLANIDHCPKCPKYAMQGTNTHHASKHTTLSNVTSTLEIGKLCNLPNYFVKVTLYLICKTQSYI